MGRSPCEGRPAGEAHPNDDEAVVRMGHTKDYGFGSAVGFGTGLGWAASQVSKGRVKAKSCWRVPLESV